MGAARIGEATAPAEVDACRALFEEYRLSQGFSPCFQGFAAEIAGLPGEYAPPRGCLLLAMVGDRPAGCVAVRPLAAEGAEMKRLYVRDAHRGAGLGRTLAREAIARAAALGYGELRLDTMPTMDSAQALYESLGFVDTGKYNDNDAAGVRFMRLALARPAA